MLPSCSSDDPISDFATLFVQPFAVPSSTARNQSKKLLIYLIVYALPYLSGRKGSLIQMGIPSAVASKLGNKDTSFGY